MGRTQSKAQIRNLSQYKKLSDEEFEEFWIEKNSNPETQKQFEDRIQTKINEFSQDYDIEDLKINDKESLRALLQAIIALEDYETIIYEIRTSGDIGQGNINIVDRLSKIMSDLRKDISKLQEDLNITRKNRKSDKESSVISYIADLKVKAKQYYESKAAYIFCPECNMLLATVWTQWPEENNKLSLKCNRTLDDGTKCGHVVNISTSELSKTKGTNKLEIIPESML